MPTMAVRMRAIDTDDAPASIGPYSQGIVDNNRIFISGQGPIDPDTGAVVSTDIREQTERTLKNIANVLRSADSSLDEVMKATVFVTDMSSYDAVNKTYDDFLSEPYPARSVVEVSDLPVDIGIEIEAIAAVPDLNRS